MNFTFVRLRILFSSLTGALALLFAFGWMLSSCSSIMKGTKAVDTKENSLSTNNMGSTDSSSDQTGSQVKIDVVPIEWNECTDELEILKDDEVQLLLRLPCLKTGEKGENLSHEELAKQVTEKFSPILKGEYDFVQNSLSIYRQESEISRFNSKGVLKDPSDIFLGTLGLSLQVAEKTDGRFDPTILSVESFFKAEKIKKESSKKYKQKKHKRKAAKKRRSTRLSETEKKLRFLRGIVNFRKLLIQKNLVLAKKAGVEITLEAFRISIMIERMSAALEKIGARVFELKILDSKTSVELKVSQKEGMKQTSYRFIPKESAFVVDPITLNQVSNLRGFELLCKGSMPSWETNLIHLVSSAEQKKWIETQRPDCLFKNQ